MVEPPVVAVLSTGRCGTQWLTAGLRKLYPGLDVEHEPIGPLYKPRRYFRRYDDPAAILEVPEVAAHVADIVGAKRQYVETGWPLFPVLPLLAQAAPERLRIVHLSRHPVPSALSHLAHGSYAGSPREDAYTRWATLGASDPGIFQSTYAGRWDALSAYEKCLFWWTEVHAYALELPERLSAIPLLRVRAEDLLSGEPAAMRRLLAFMDLEWREAWLEHAADTVDRWHHHTDQDVDPLLARQHPLTVVVAQRLGYDVGAIDPEALLARYRGKPDPGLDRIGRYEAAPR